MNLIQILLSMEIGFCLGFLFCMATFYRKQGILLDRAIKGWGESLDLTDEILLRIKGIKEEVELLDTDKVKV